MSRRKQQLAEIVASAGARSGAMWLAVYCCVCVTGQKFSIDYLNFGWQMVPWDILSNDPVRSVWYLHIQPPLWNLLLGSAAWLSPISDRITLQIIMAMFGSAVAWLSTVLAERLGLTRKWSIVVALIASLHPEVFKGAFEPTYELATAALLLATLIAVSDLVRTEHTRRSLLMLAGVVTVTSLTRSLYHPVWAIAIVIFGLWLVRQRISWRTVGLVLAVPVIFMGSWMMKNEVLFGHATMSSWFGMNLQRAVIPVLPKQDLDDMFERGEISDIAMIGPFGKYELYQDVVEPCLPKHKYRSLVEPMRTTDQWSPNFNYECFLPIYDQAGADAFAVIKEHPEAWLEGRLWSLRTTVALGAMPPESKSVVMRSLDTIFSVLRVDVGGVLSTRGWGTPIYGQLEAPVDFGLLLVPMYVFAGLLAVWLFLRRLLKRSLPDGAAVLMVGSFTVAFTVIVGAIAELGEQARFRTMVDPLVTVMVLALLVRAVRRRRKSTDQSQEILVGK